MRFTHNDVNFDVTNVLHYVKWFKGPFTSSDSDATAISLLNGSQSDSAATSQSLGVTMQHQNN